MQIAETLAIDAVFIAKYQLSKHKRRILNTLPVKLPRTLLSCKSPAESHMA